MKFYKLLCGVLFIALAVGAGNACAAGKIGVINLQEVIAKSKAGQAAAKKLDSKTAAFREKFQVEEKNMKELQMEIEKKSSVWSEDKRAAKIRELQKIKRTLKEKAADASFELKQLQDKELSPILTKLRVIVKEYSKANGYDLILEKMAGVAYFNDSINVTPAIIKELDKKMSGK